MKCCGIFGLASPTQCNSICRKELDSRWSWLVCLCATLNVALLFGVSLNFGVLFPVLMDYFQESRERTGKRKGPLISLYYIVGTCRKGISPFLIWKFSTGMNQKLCSISVATRFSEKGRNQTTDFTTPPPLPPPHDGK